MILMEGMNRRLSSEMGMRISVIIPVLNEAGMINLVIEHIRALGRDYHIEIVVADGDPPGTTIRSIADESVIKVVSGRGRGRQMNAGAAASSGDVLLFLHADTLLPAGAFGHIRAVMESGRYAGGAFDLGIDSARKSMRIIEQVASARSRLKRVPYGDQAIFVSRDVFNSIGGFIDLPIMEDVELMRNIKRAGHRIAIIPHRVRTSPRRWDREGVVYCTARNWALVTLYLMGFKPETLARFYK